MRPSVLVACDPADDDRSAVDFGRVVAGLVHAPLKLVHVQASESLTGSEPSFATRMPADVRVLAAGSAAAGLQRLIATEQPLLTVLGSAHDAPHGRVGVGSTTERVLHGAARAVAVVPRGHAERAFGTIGVGLLPTSDSLRALRAGARLARAAGAPLLVLTVLRRSPDRADAATLAAHLAPHLFSGEEAPAAEILRAAIVAAAREGEAEPSEWPPATGELSVEPLVLVGDPVDALLRASGTLSLLVLGSRAYGPPGVVMPGGAARRVLAAARCPVLMVPRSDVSVALKVPA